MATELASSRAEKFAPLLVVAAAVVAGVNAIDALPVGVYYDDALYVILGKSLSAGHGYRYINLPGAPAATHYPPGYPALIALLWRLSPEFPANIALFKMTNALLLGVVALCTWRFARLTLDMRWPVAAFVALVGASAIPMLVLSSGVMSETLFLAVLLPLLVRIEREDARGSPRAALMIGAWIALAFYVRAHAIALIPAAAVVLLLKGRRRDTALLVTGALALILPWLLWVRAHDGGIPVPLRGSYGSYLGWLADGLRMRGLALLWDSAWQNLVTIYAIVARSFSVADHVVLDAVAVMAVTTLCAAGVVAWWRQARATLVFLACYFAIAVVWPFSPLRFVWGVWPLLVALMCSGAQLLLQYPGSARLHRRLRVAGTAAAGVVLLGALVFNIRGYANAWWATVGRAIAPRIQPQLQWTVANTRPSDILAVEDEGAVYLYTGRRAVPVNTFTAEQHVSARSAAQDAANLAAVLGTFAPDYVIAWAVPTMRATAELSSRKPALLATVDTIPGGLVFRRIAR